MNQHQVGEHILHFCSVKEPGAADDAIRECVSSEGLLQHIGLGIGPVEDGKISEIPCSLLLQNLPGDKFCFPVFVDSFVEQDVIPDRIIRPEVFPLSSDVVGNDSIGCAQNGFGGAVILFQTDDAGAFILIFKTQNVFNGGAAELVNALVVVADDTDIFILPGQQGGKKVLKVVGVLVFVDQDIAELPLVVVTDILAFLKR